MKSFAHSLYRECPLSLAGGGQALTVRSRKLMVALVRWLLIIWGDVEEREGGWG